MEAAVQGSFGTSLFHSRLENSGPTQQFCFAQYFAGRDLKRCSSSERSAACSQSLQLLMLPVEKLYSQHCKGRQKQKWELGDKTKDQWPRREDRLLQASWSTFQDYNCRCHNSTFGSFFWVLLLHHIHLEPQCYCQVLFDKISTDEKENIFTLYMGSWALY